MNALKLFGAASILSFALACGSPVNTGGACNATTCTGCCFNGACQSGDTDTACGKSATTCVTCGTGQTCGSDQTCGFDRAAMFRVQPLSATVKADNNGAQWDQLDNSGPDPKVDLYCPGTQSSVTATVGPSSNTSSPTWSSGGCVLSVGDLLDHGFSYQVLDDDPIGADSITGKTQVTVTNLDLIAGSARVVPSDALTAFSVALQKQ